MRALAISVGIFINLIFFGMCGYMYLLWSQYWMSLERPAETTASTYDQQIYFYNRGYLPNEVLSSNKSRNSSTGNKVRSKHSVKDNVTLIKNSKPRFPNLQQKEFETDTKKYTCFKNDSLHDCDKKTADFKDKMLTELRKVLTDESNIMKTGLDNLYGVQFKGVRKNFMDKAPTQLLCELRKIKVLTLKRSDVPNSNQLKYFIPKRQLFENKNFNSCAIVASAGALKDSGLGKFIDSHDLVLRFNHAPTKGFEADVGKKTTIRVLNSQVVTKREFNFLKSDMYKNITLVVWDPSNYTSTIREWLDSPDFNLFPNYMEHRKNKSRFFILNPRSVWSMWDFLQINSPGRLRRNPPSSGFLGLGILLPHCNFVDIVEYVPSTRVTKRCHYYDPEDNPACTFGVWHPLAAEKLISYHVNVAEDKDVFQKGFVRISGFKKFSC